MKTINWKVSTEDFDTSMLIARRANNELRLDLRSTMMDLNATHANGNPLDLHGLVMATPFDFAHDVLGINQHIDRETGNLMNCFSPRYSRKEVAAQNAL